jgi:hypothetical protein
MTSALARALARAASQTLQRLPPAQGLAAAHPARGTLRFGRALYAGAAYIKERLQPPRAAHARGPAQRKARGTRPGPASAGQPAAPSASASASASAGAGALPVPSPVPCPRRLAAAPPRDVTAGARPLRALDPPVCCQVMSSHLISRGPHPPAAKAILSLASANSPTLRSPPGCPPTAGWSERLPCSLPRRSIAQSSPLATAAIAPPVSTACR